MRARVPKVLVLSRNYPNSVTPILGLWVEGLVRHVSKSCDVRVIAPTPYCPPLPGLGELRGFRTIAKSQCVGGVDVTHPRFLTGPGNSTYNVEAKLYYWSIRREVDRLRDKFPFDLIHAHFGYPDGVVAAKLAKRYKVPFIITEHASWVPWMNNYPMARRQAVWAASRCSFHIAVSNFARQTIEQFTGETGRLRVLPNGVDVNVFRRATDFGHTDPNQLLYVGFMRRVKGVDILLRAMALLVKQKPDLRLVLIGGGIYRDSKSQEEELRQLARELKLEKNVEFVGIKTPREVARFMCESSLLVLPSRTETFGAVLIEALACGIPVVATRCGGTEDIVKDEFGRLAEKENPEDLAMAIMDVILRRKEYDPVELRQYALENFSWEEVARRTGELYYEAISAKYNSPEMEVSL